MTIGGDRFRLATAHCLARHQGTHLIGALRLNIVSRLHGAISMISVSEDQAKYRPSPASMIAIFEVYMTEDLLLESLLLETRFLEGRMDAAAAAAPYFLTVDVAALVHGLVHAP